MSAKNKPPREKLLDAEHRAIVWLSEYNVLEENGKGNSKYAQMAYRKATYWLERMNRLEDLLDGTSIS